MNAIRVNPRYVDLLSRIPPKVIRTEEENEQYIEALYELEQRSGSLTPEEQELADLLSLLIEDFEDKRYALPQASPGEVLAFLMEQHDLKADDLSSLLEAPSAVIRGQRELSKSEIRLLSERFHVSPEVFF